jgi:hypothetical protein
LWEEVNAELRALRRDESGVPRTKQNALLAGLLFCKNCDQPMVPTYATKRGLRYRYYLCTTAKKNGWAACPTKSVSSQVIEESVIEQLRTTLAADEAREELQVTDREWQHFLEVGNSEFVRSLCERLSYDGTTGIVSLSLKPFECPIEEGAP